MILLCLCYVPRPNQECLFAINTDRMWWTSPVLILIFSISVPTNERLSNKDKGNSTRDEKSIMSVHGILEINEKHVFGTYFSTYIRTRQNSRDINRYGARAKKNGWYPANGLPAGKIPLPVVQKTRENPDYTFLDKTLYSGKFTLPQQNRLEFPGGWGRVSKPPKNNVWTSIMPIIFELTCTWSVSSIYWNVFLHLK